MDERRGALEKRRREIEDLQPLRSSAETQVGDAEKRESDAKNDEDAAWNGNLAFETIIIARNAICRVRRRQAKRRSDESLRQSRSRQRRRVGFFADCSAQFA